MKQIDVIEYLPDIMRELKKGILVNTKNGDKKNSMTIAWGQIGIEWNKLIFTTYIRHTRFTHEQIEASNEFTVSIPLSRTPEITKAIGLCGSKNGKNIDKFQECNLTTLDGTSVKSPAIKEFPLTLECKVIYKQEQEHNNIPNELYEKFYKNTPSSDNTITNDDFHTVYYGEIVNAYILEDSDFNPTEKNYENKKNKKALWISLLALMIMLGAGLLAYNKIDKPYNYKTIVREEINSIYSNTGLVNDSRIRNFVNKNPEILNRIAITAIRESLSENNSIKTKNVAITLKNKTNIEIRDLEVVINILDKKGNIIEDEDKELDTLTPNSEYTFIIPIKYNNAENWELAEIKD